MSKNNRGNKKKGKAINKVAPARAGEQKEQPKEHASSANQQLQPSQSGVWTMFLSLSFYKRATLVLLTLVAVGGFLSWLSSTEEEVRRANMAIEAVKFDAPLSANSPIAISARANNKGPTSALGATPHGVGVVMTEKPVFPVLTHDHPGKADMVPFTPLEIPIASLTVRNDGVTGDGKERIGAKLLTDADIQMIHGDASIYLMFVVEYRHVFQWFWERGLVMESCWVAHDVTSAFEVYPCR